MDQLLISCVVPVYRGVGTLRQLVDELADWRLLVGDYALGVSLAEVVFVDDGSRDGSAHVLAELEAEFPWIHVVTLSRNFGQHAATMAGILQTSGDWVVTLDEDLQHRPQWIWSMLHLAAREGLDVVYPAPTGDPHRSWYRNAASRGLKKAVSWTTQNPHVRLYNSFRILRGEVARAASAVAGPEAYFDVVVGWFTDRVGTHPVPLVDTREQETGQKSSYTLPSLVAHARRLILSSPPRVLRYVLPVAVSVSLVSLIYLSITIVRRLIVPEAIPVQGWASLAAISLFFGAACVALLGVSIEFQGMQLQHATGRPVYFIVDRSSDRLICSLPSSLDRHDYLLDRTG